MRLRVVPKLGQRMGAGVGLRVGLRVGYQRKFIEPMVSGTEGGIESCTLSRASEYVLRANDKGGI